jgi:uncharacterized membrane protein
MKLFKKLLIGAFIGAIVIGYFYLMYTSAFASDSGARTLVLTVLAWQLFAQVILWRQGKRTIAIALSLVCLPFLYFYQHLDAIQWVNLVPNTLIYGSLAFMFGRTLQPGQISLITQLATKIQNDLPPPIYRYTRHVTIAWTIFFALSVVVGIGLYYFVSFAAWSLFSNVYATPLLIGMFVAEYAYRRLRFRGFKHASFSDGMKAFMNHSANSDSAKSSSVDK